MNTPHKNLIDQIALEHKIDPTLVMAIMMAESEGDEYRPRYEPGFKDFWHVRHNAETQRISYVTEEALQRMSWGPMQVMGAVARWLGYSGPLVLLSTAEVSITYGCKYIQWLTQRKHIVGDAHVIAAYNAGPSVGKTPGGMFLNQASYVDKVCRILTELRKLGE